MLEYLKKKFKKEVKIDEVRQPLYRRYSDLKTNGKDLIVDDSELNRNTMKLYLSKFNRTADEAINGEDAILKIKANGIYKIVWMDVQMPMMNGIICTTKLRNEFGYGGCILGLTGHVDEESIGKCKTAGMNDVLAKPLDKYTLETFINQYSK